MADHAADERRSLNTRVTRLEREVKLTDQDKLDSRLSDVQACMQVLTEYTEDLHRNPPASKGAGQAALPDQCEETLYGVRSEAPSRP